MSRERFLQEYHLEVEQEFDPAAQWAPGTSGPRFWGEEDSVLDLVQGDQNKSNVPSTAIATSPDHSLLAIATNAVIRVYHNGSKQHVSELVGHPSNVWKIHLVPAPASTVINAQSGNAKYILLSEGAGVSGADGDIIFWYLDGEGRCLNGRTMPFAVEKLTDSAIGAISDDLKTHHELPEEEISTIRTGFADILKAADARNRVQNLPHLEGHLPKFGAKVISHDGQHMLYITHGRTTQHGMRPPEELPQIAVVDLADRSERCRLKGHTDAIMWASWSPDGTIIATACWDQTYKLWDAETGECKHTIGPTGGQNWAGHFSPDGKHVLLSGGSPTKVAIYDVQTAEEITHLEYDGRKGWMRTVSWNAQTNAIALTFDHTQSVIFWQPYVNKHEEILKLKNDGSQLDRFCSFQVVKWVDEGKKLVVQTNESSIFVWEPEKQLKWRLQRPMGTKQSTYSHEVLFNSETQTLVSLNGDGKVREWRL